MDQPTFAELEFQGKKRKTRRELFLERMDGLIPWQRLEEGIRPVYPKAGNGRRPYPLAVMLRIHCVQLFYNLSDPGVQDLLYEAESVRRFVGLKLSGTLPDETTILNFRHLLERNRLGEGLLQEINAHLESQGLRLREGTIVDASIIEAPSSTKNRAGERDPEMHQTKKGNQWYFGMKVHIGVDADTGLVHSMSTTAANVHDITEAHNLLHGGETMVWSGFPTQCRRRGKHEGHELFGNPRNGDRVHRGHLQRPAVREIHRNDGCQRHEYDADTRRKRLYRTGDGRGSRRKNQLASTSENTAHPIIATIRVNAHLE